MAIYKIKNVAEDKCVTISRTNSSTNLTDRLNVILSTDANSPEQMWSIDRLNTGVTVRSMIDETFGLNVYRSGDPYNCNILAIKGNEIDSAINIWKNTYCTIKLQNYYLYLTVANINEGTNVYWESYTGNVTQLWVCEQVSGTILTMPQNLNQTYEGNEECIQESGCCVCCCCDVASYYNGSNYTLAQMKNYGVYYADNANCHWGNVPSVTFNRGITKNSDAEYYALIRSEINAGRPVIVYTTGGFNHFVVAYGYIEQGANRNQIMVLDPSGADDDYYDGRCTTFEAAYIRHKANKIEYVCTTARK